MKDYRAIAEATRAQVWDRWEEGLGLSEISRTLGVRQIRVCSIVAACGGIRPPQRRRSERVLSAAEREEISRGVAAGCSMREIADICSVLPRASVGRSLAMPGHRVIAR